MGTKGGSVVVEFPIGTNPGQQQVLWALVSVQPQGEPHPLAKVGFTRPHLHEPLRKGFLRVPHPCEGYPYDFSACYQPSQGEPAKSDAHPAGCQPRFPIVAVAILSKRYSLYVRCIDFQGLTYFAGKH